jgi:hypothetical protein
MGVVLGEIYRDTRGEKKSRVKGKGNDVGEDEVSV